jgi:hypothetical protein
MKHGSMHVRPHQQTKTSLGDVNEMASANSRIRTFVQASRLNTSLDPLWGKVEIKNGERARHGFRGIAPWNVSVVNVHGWLQRFKRFVGCDVDHLSVGQMRRFNIRRIVVGADGIRRVLFSEPQPVDNRKDRDGRQQHVKSLGLRDGQVVEVVSSFAA